MNPIEEELRALIGPLMLPHQELSCWIYDGFLVAETTWHFSVRGQDHAPDVAVWLDGESPHMAVSVQIPERNPENGAWRSREESILSVQYLTKNSELPFAQILEGTATSRQEAWSQVKEAVVRAWRQVYPV